jgi:hypothetical protein
MKKFYSLIASVLIAFSINNAAAQAFSWNNYSAAANSYSNASNGTTMSVAVTGSGHSNGFPAFQNSNGGFLGCSVDWSNRTTSVTYTITFSKPLLGVIFLLYDVDQTSTWDDRVTISAKDNLNATVYPSITANTYSAVSGTNNNILEGTGNNGTFTAAPASVSFGSRSVNSITIVYSAGSSSPSNPAVQIIGIGNITYLNLLPIDLVSYKAEKKNNGAQLSWITENQVNFSHFEIERSSSATGTFEKVGTVTATTATTGNYSFLDASAGQYMEKAYYRLRMVDVDGNAKYSAVAVVSFETAVVASIRPSLLQAGQPIQVFIAGNGQVKATVRLFDISGKMLSQKNEVSGQTQVETNGLQKGTYVVSVQGSSFSKSFRVVVQ